jgi:Ni2+-binding GTPase involved in maturation of urease and hydrogenase
MKIKSIKEFIKYINNNKLSEAQESYMRGIVTIDNLTFEDDYFMNREKRRVRDVDSNRLTR